MTTHSAIITPDLIASALTYDQYISLSKDLFAQGRTTSEAPSYNTPEILGYTKLNLHRMSRLDKLTVVSNDLKAAMAKVSEPWVWLVLTESWCGDAAQAVPVLHQMAEQSSHVQIRFLLRDKNPDVMNAYLTNGGKSIPKLICLRASDLTEIGTWGPRPAGLQALMNNWRTEQLPLSEAVERAQRWYNEDRTQSIQQELLALVTNWNRTESQRTPSPAGPYRVHRLADH
ncbi:thioredoxin family protein [Spirosoma soli]|uniref:Thioredoxin family protein n=1 Tax=Spirosoma soli TaxID=1770529 RepID=A0ABW5M526_9BACT